MISEEAEEPDIKTFTPTYSEFTKGSKTHLFIDLQDPGNEEAFNHFAGMLIIHIFI